MADNLFRRPEIVLGPANRKKKASPLHGGRGDIASTVTENSYRSGVVISATIGGARFNGRNIPGEFVDDAVQVWAAVNGVGATVVNDKLRDPGASRSTFKGKEAVKLRARMRATRSPPPPAPEVTIRTSLFGYV